MFSNVTEQTPEIKLMWYLFSLKYILDKKNLKKELFFLCVLKGQYALTV